MFVKGQSCAVVVPEVLVVVMNVMVDAGPGNVRTAATERDVVVQELPT